MKIEITTNGEATEVELGHGTVTVGGTKKDGIQIEGLAPAQAELRVDGERLLVLSHRTFTVDGVLSPPGVPRLVLVGERIGLGEGISLRQLAEPAEAPKGTQAVLRQLLVDVADPEDARCATLTCLTGLDLGRRFPLAGQQAEIGRGDEVQVRIRDRAVSRKHARIRLSGGEHSVEDLRTPNGVFVNGKRLREKTVLHDGDVLELGHSLLRFRAPENPPPPEPAPEPAPKSAAAPAGESAPPADSQSDSQPEGSGANPQARAEGEPGSPSASPGTGTGTAPEKKGAKKKRRSPGEVALIGLGVALALIGVVVTFGMVSG